MNRSLPCWRDRCIGKACGNFNDPNDRWGDPKMKAGCKGNSVSPWAWAEWYEDFYNKRHNTKGGDGDG